MSDSDQSLYTIRYNQVTQGMEGFGGGSPMWTPLVLTADGAHPAGLDTQVQYNANGSFGASESLYFIRTGNMVFAVGQITAGNPNPTTLSICSDTQGQLEFDSGDGNTAFSYIRATSDGAIAVASGVGMSVNDAMQNTKPDASAVLQAQSTTRGFLPPAMSTVNRTAISSPADGLLVYDTDLHQLFQWQNGSWVALTAGGTITSWSSQTGVWTGLGTTSASQLFTRRVGDSMEATFSVVAGTPTAVSLSLTIPGGLHVDTSKIPTNQNNVLGNLTASNPTPNTGVFVNTTGMIATARSGDTTQIYFDYSVGADGSGQALSTAGTASGLINATGIVAGRFTVPILEWA